MYGILSLKADVLSIMDTYSHEWEESKATLSLC